MKTFYKELINEIEKNGELSPVSRKKIWDRLEEVYGIVGGKDKRKVLNLKSLKKVQESWEIYSPISSTLKKQVETVLEILEKNKQDRIKEAVEEFYKECDLQKHERDSFYIDYLTQSIKYLIIQMDSALTEEECVPQKNEDLEFEEYDTSYCACMMWKYQDIESGEKIRREREIEFWEWYVKEVAQLFGDSVEDNIKIPSYLLKDSNLQIDSIENFVKAISYELDYIKYEKKEKNKILVIYVYEHKNGLECPRCGVFSNHIEASLAGKELLGKFEGWMIEFKLRVNIYHCDNEKCSENIFPSRTKVGHNEKKANFLHIIKQKKKAEIIKKLFEL